MREPRVVIVGAGVGGLSAALSLAARGMQPLILERARTPGGKLREVVVEGARLDAGPTVFTLRSVFDQLFADAGLPFAAHVTLKRADLLARHAWSDGTIFDLFADVSRSADAIGTMAGKAEARGFLDCMREAARMYAMLERTYLHASRPTALSLALRISARDARDLLHLHPFSELWELLGRYFRDSRLRQLFGRYATYCGSSPFLAPATLMLIAHVEREGVWLVEGGMYRLVQALTAAAVSCGSSLRCGAEVAEVLIERGRATGVMLTSGERIDADAVIVNADPAAVSGGLFGEPAIRALPPPTTRERTLSAITWNLRSVVGGFPLAHHTVFFSSNYHAEFEQLFRRQQLPSEATVYVCAQDRDDANTTAPNGAERLLCLVNAPATGDSAEFGESEIQTCEQQTFSMLSRCGLKLERNASNCIVTTPRDFHAMFPATGGALYGQPSHGWRASFLRPHSRTKIAGLYLAGGGTHPGPGLPMAAISGRLAATCLQQDWDSTSPSR